MLKNTIVRIYPYFAVVIAVSLISLVIIASCSPYKALEVKESPHAYRTEPPADAFVLIGVRTSISADSCDPPSDNCLSVIEDLPVIRTKKTGSGMAIWHDGKVHVITAEHVCSDDDEPSHFNYAEKDVRIKLGVKSEVQVVGIDGIARKATIVSMNKDMDLCALDVPEFSGGSVSLAIGPPVIGDRVYSIAAPYGLGGETLSLVFDGYYSGNRDAKHYYTIPTRPGSSGAIVLNSDWRAIGSLHTAFVPLESIGIGAGWSDLKLFLESINH